MLSRIFIESQKAKNEGIHEIFQNLLGDMDFDC
jgi:hypothetical protein